jgi:hypothetical protein
METSSSRSSSSSSSTPTSTTGIAASSSSSSSDDDALFQQEKRHHATLAKSNQIKSLYENGDHEQVAMLIQQQQDATLQLQRQYAGARRRV